MQLDPKALDETQIAFQEQYDRGLDYDELSFVIRAYLQAVQPVPVVTTITAATIEKACTDPIEIWPTGWRETYPALASPNVGTVKARLLAALTATARAEPVAIPDGWKLVPVKPTNEMVSAVRDIAGAQAAAYGLAAWDTMLKAAPVSGADNAK